MVMALENKITEAQALSDLEGSIYLALYQFLVYRPKGSTTQSALDDYDEEHRAFFHTFEATSDWQMGCLRRRARRNIVSIKEGQEGNHRYPSSWESVGVEKRRRCTRRSCGRHSPSSIFSARSGIRPPCRTS
jgi:hypothetical protein